MIARVTRRLRQKRIVILGGGFGGVYAAMQLEKLLAADRVAEISLVSHDNFFLFTASRDRRKRSRDHEHRKSSAEITPQS
jgi:hypothetical protein